MTDFLHISYEKDENTNASGICIARVGENGTTDVLKMALDGNADILYKILTDPTIRVNKLNVKEYDKLNVKDEYEKQKNPSTNSGWSLPDNFHEMSVERQRGYLGIL